MSKLRGENGEIVEDLKEIKDKLIAGGVKNLREYGYPKCDASNICTDYIYKAFFASMLRDNKGKMGSKVDRAIDALLAQCA